jgi:glycerate kinase
MPAVARLDAQALTAMRILLAFDKFKDGLPARSACDAAAAALSEVHPGWMVDACPLTDGGEGFAETLTTAAQGALSRVTVRGPLDAPVNADFGIVSSSNIPPAARALLQLPAENERDASVAIIEMAAASGLALLKPELRDPWRTSSRGTGELVLEAAARGVSSIVLGVGGSATNDIGLGVLAALGVRFRSASGRLLTDLAPLSWDHVADIEGIVTPGLPPIRIACDVANPLLGPSGCTATFAPQKGLPFQDLPRLEAAVARMSGLLCRHAGQPTSLRELSGMGAAGGIVFGLSCCAGALRLPGFELVAAWLDLQRRIEQADIVITGEGRFDTTSLGGKGPGAIAAAAAALGRRVEVFAGQIQASGPTGVGLHAITPAGMPLAEALPRTSELLKAAVRRTFEAG